MTLPREGYWNFGDVKSMLCVIKGKEMSAKNIVCLDYPDIQSSFSFNIDTGDFGMAKKEVTDATGVTNYNIHLKNNFLGLKAVLNDEGTKMTLWGFSNMMEVWEWITPETVKEMAEDRDDADAPR